jgi:iron(III) transport system permease protein
VVSLLPQPTGPVISRDRKPGRRPSFKAGESRFSLFSGGSLVLALLFAAVALYPIGHVLVRLFFDGGSLNTDLFVRLVNTPGLFELLRNTVILVLAGGVLAVLAGSVLAWLVVRTDAKIKWVGDVLPLLPFLIPPIVGVIGWSMLLAPATGFINAALRGLLGLVGITMTEGPLDIYSWGGMIFVYALYTTPFTFLLVAAGLQNMDSQLEEQARVSGAGVLRTLWTVTIPAVRPSLGAAMLLTVWYGFAFFSGPAILSSRSGIDVLAERIVQLLTFTYPPDIEMAVGLSTFMLLAVAIAWWLQTRVLRRSNFVTIGGRGKSTEIELGRWKWVGRLVILGYIFGASILPALALLWVALRGFWSTTLSFEAINLNSFVQMFQDSFTSKAIVTSFGLAFVGATIGMIAAAIIARFVQSSGGRLGRAVDVLVKIGAPIPAVVLAVGVLLAFGGQPFMLNGTLLILLLAYLAHYLPQATVNADAAAAQVGPQLLEASHISGAGDARTFVKISLPLMLPGLLAGWTLLFLWMFGELNASVILAGTQNPVVGAQIYSLYNQGFFGRLAALAILLLVINVTVVTVMGLLGRWVRGGRTRMRSS